MEGRAEEDAIRERPEQHDRDGDADHIRNPPRNEPARAAGHEAGGKPEQPHERE